MLQEEYKDLVLDGVNELVEDYFGAKVVADSANQIITEVVEEMIPDAVSSGITLSLFWFLAVFFASFKNILSTAFGGITYLFICL